MQLPTFRSLRFGLLGFCLLAVTTLFSYADTAAKFDTPPRPIKTRPPAYPDKLREEGVSGAVSVVLDIDENGKVVDATVNKASNDLFREPALNAVRQWVFAPAKLAGKSVPSRVTIPLLFSTES